MADSESILKEIEKLEIRLAKMDHERKTALRHLAQLRDQLAQQEGPAFQSTSASTKQAFSPREKIALFRSLFVGRTDVFPKYWRNQKTVASDVKRNDMILDDVIQALEDRRSPILLTERRDHLDFFAKNLRGFTRHLVVLRGGMGAKQRREAVERMASIPESDERLLLATGRFIGEGFDDSRLDTLFLTLPVPDAPRLVEGYAGAIRRPSPPSSPREERSSDLRLCGPQGANALQDVRQACRWVPPHGLPNRSTDRSQCRGRKRKRRLIA